ncbi:AfsR/SARP family transcriptional regulator [Streptomyces lonarensis]|nr:BTAD domain-containing putative transcriptional regulator [Streptomyces lonarensis]
MRFGVLGPLEVRTADGRPVRVPELKVRGLLAALLVRPGRPVPVDRLIEDVWPGRAPANPVASLHSKVSQLRRALENAEPGGRRSVVHRPPGYALDTPAEAVDACRFQQLTAEARASAELSVRAGLLSEALGLWRGAAFADFADEPFARGAIARLAEERLAAQEDLGEVRLELGEHHELIGELSDLVGRHPLRERLRSLFMRALYRAGRTAEALESYRELRGLLDEELALAPGPELVALHLAILRQEPLGAASPHGRPRGAVPHSRTPLDPHRRPAADERHEPPPGNIPQPLSGLIGRESAVAEVGRLVSAERLVTLTGPGGVGKTRLALATATHRAASFDDGVWLVEFAGSLRPGDPSDAGTLAEVVMGALGIREGTGAGTLPVREPIAPTRRLLTALATKRLLLVADNGEHVLAALADLVQSLLPHAPHLAVLVTSQEPLGVPGETVWAVPPLELPPAKTPRAVRTSTARAPEPLPPDVDPAVLEQYSAVRLFVARATSADAAFVLDAETAPAVAAVCRHLDGVPLALELAAVRTRALGVRTLLERLDDRLHLLTRGNPSGPERQRTLRAMIGWSWDLLDAAERTVLRRLSVHVGGCTLGAAEQVCSWGGVAPHDVLELLPRLVDRSLVVRAESGAGTRYRLLESVAAYVRERLDEAGETEVAESRHLAYCVRLAEEAESRLGGSDQEKALALLDAEAGNLARALESAERRREPEMALRLVNALSWYWFLRGRPEEAKRSLETVARLIHGADRSCPAAPGQDEALARHAAFSLLTGEDPAAVEKSARPLPAPESVGPHRARAEWFLGHACWSVGALAAGERRVEWSLDVFRAAGDRWGVAAALTTRAALAMARGDLVSLRRDGDEALALFLDLGDQWGRLKATDMLSVLAEATGDYESATRLHSDGVAIAEALGLWSEVSRKLAGLGRMALLQGAYPRAEELHGRARLLAVEQANLPVEQYAEVGIALGARRQGDLDRAEAHLRPWLDWNRERGAMTGLALVLAELGFVAELRGDVESALALHGEGLSAARSTGDPRAVALALEGLAGAHALAGGAERAAWLLGAADAMRRSAGAPLPPAERGDVERITAAIGARLTPPRLRAAFAAGGLAGAGAGDAPEAVAIPAGGPERRR